MPVEDQLSPRQWLRQAAQHEAEAEALLGSIHGHEPDSGFVRYALDAAKVRADLAKASATAARAAATQDPMDDGLRSLVSVATGAVGSVGRWFHQKRGRTPLRVAMVEDEEEPLEQDEANRRWP